MEEENKKVEEPQEEKQKQPINIKKESSKKETLTDVMRKNPWVGATVVLGIIVLILLVNNFSGLTGSTITGSVVAGDDAGQAILDIVKLKTPDAELVGVEKENGLYKVTFSAEGQESSVYVTLDGENLIDGGLIPLSVIKDQQTQTLQETTPAEGYSETDLEELREFSSCLASNGLKIYGANWCGWTKKLVIDTLGGFDVVGAAYVECTEEQELCQSEGVTGYPTIKLDGEVYSGERTLEALAEATNCIVPELEGTGAVASSEDASCS